MFKKILALLVLSLPLAAAAQAPSASPTMTYTDSLGMSEEVTEYDGSAPFEATFAANPSDVGGYTAHYEWRFSKSGEENPFLIRYDENTTYNFRKTGSFVVELRVTFEQAGDTIEFVQDTPFTINIRESRLEVPNAFTPNGDGVNDVFKVKDGYESIVEFEAMVFTRSGKLVHKWKDITQGWDGTSNGHKMPDGGYYLRIKAKGADGRNYNIKKVINLLRGYLEESTTGV